MTAHTDKSARTARSILERSLRVFAVKGPHAASAKDVAEACGLSVGSIYVHYGSKDLLYLRLLEDALRQAALYAQARAWSSSPLQRVWNTGEAYLEFGKQHADAFRLLARRVELDSTDPLVCALQSRLAAEIDAEVDAAIGRLQDDVEQAVREGELAPTDPRALAIFLGSTWTGVVTLMLRSDRFGITAAEARQMLTSAQRMATDGTAAAVAPAAW